jgi:hypothetical protein
MKDVWKDSLVGKNIVHHTRPPIVEKIEVDGVGEK